MKYLILSIVLIFSTNLIAKSAKNKKSNFDSKEFFKGIKLDRIGGHLSLIKPSDFDATLGFGLDLPLGTVSKKNIGIHTGIEYWSESNVNVDTKDIIISASGVYNFKKINKKPITPYAGAGLALHLVSSDVIVNGVKTERSDSNMGIDLFAGGKYDYKKNLDFYTEARWRIVSDLGQLAITAGVIYKFK